MPDGGWCMHKMDEVGGEGKGEGAAWQKGDEELELGSLGARSAGDLSRKIRCVI